MALPAFLLPLAASVAMPLIGAFIKAKQKEGLSWKSLLGPAGTMLAGGEGAKSLNEELLGTDTVKEEIAKYPPEVQKMIPEFLSLAMEKLREEPEKFPELAELYQKDTLPQELDFGPIEQQARSKFYQDTIPTLAERFTSMGQGAQRSSGFQQALGRAGTGLEENLAALKAKVGPDYALRRAGLGLQQGNLGLRHAMAKQAAGIAGDKYIPALLKAGLTPSFDVGITPGSPGLFGAMAPGMGQAAGSLLAGLFR